MKFNMDAYIKTQADLFFLKNHPGIYKSGVGINDALQYRNDVLSNQGKLFLELLK